jgi:hypothetical protein
VKLAAQAPRQEGSRSLAVVWKHASKAVISHAPLSSFIPDARLAIGLMSFPTRAQRAIGNPEMPIIRELLWIPDQAFGLSGMTLDHASTLRQVLHRGVVSFAAHAWN